MADRQRQGKDPRQRGHPPGSAAPDFCGQAARGRAHAFGLQHPEGEHAPLGLAPPWGCRLSTVRYMRILQSPSLGSLSQEPTLACLLSKAQFELCCSHPLLVAADVKLGRDGYWEPGAQLAMLSQFA